MRFYIERNRKTAGARRLQRKLQAMGHRCAIGYEQPYRKRARTLIEWGGNQINKLDFFNMVDRESLPIYWAAAGKEDCQRWLNEKPKRRIMVRHLLNASGGKGCEVVESGNPLPDAPLYVEYIPKDAEYRVHCFKNPLGTTHYTQQKRKRRETEVNFLIRNLSNGWVYCTDGVIAPVDVTSEAIKAFESTGLDFGAVDVIWNKKREKAYVLEINTAPGLEGKTVDVYANYFVNVG